MLGNDNDIIFFLKKVIHFDMIFFELNHII